MAAAAASAAPTTTMATTTSTANWKQRFDRELKVMGVSVEPKLVGEVVAKLKPAHLLLDRAKLKHVTADPCDPKAKKVVLFADTLHAIGEISDQAAKEYVEKLIADGKAVLREAVCLHVDWTHFTAKEILKELLGTAAAVEGTSFETIGHIAHVNIPDSQLGDKKLIGDVLLQKNYPRIKTVVNKTGMITNEFRTFPMEVLAGEETLETTVIEYGCKFRLNYADVYWNSKLEGEHSRLVDTFTAKDVIADAFAGIGPFAIPAAKKFGCRALANDLNPKSVEWCRINCKDNGVEKLVQCFNLDAREFMKKYVSAANGITRVVMNLPADAILFLDTLGDLARSGAWKSLKEAPVIHCYSFTRNVANPLEDLMQRAKEAIGEGAEPIPVTPGEIKGVNPIHDVRDVAPNKRMFCLSIRIMPTTTAAGAIHTPPPTKKQCTEASSSFSSSSSSSSASKC